MPCIFLKNLPISYSLSEPKQTRKEFDGFLTRRLRLRIANTAQVDVEGVNIYLSYKDYALLNNDGEPEDCTYIIGFVLWHGSEKRNSEVKREIANALQRFLNHHDLGKGFDLTFMDMPASSFFLEKDGVSIRVLGGEPTIPFSLLNYTVSEATGWSADGFYPDDAVLF